jgi:surfeit locus 1 family protein
MRFHFHFRWIPFLAALVVALAGVALGEWQRGRALGKEAIAAAVQERSALPPLTLPGTAQGQAAQDVEFRQVLARGEFMPNWLLYLDNRPQAGRAGLVLVAPLRLADGKVVLVMRGWLARDLQDRSRVPPAVIPAGEVRVTGRLRRDTGHLLQLGQAGPLAPQAIVQNLQPQDFAAATGLDVLPFIIEESAAPDRNDGLVRDWPQPDSGAAKHRGYAFQWYALAVTALVFFLVTGFRNRSGTKQGTSH